MELLKFLFLFFTIFGPFFGFMLYLLGKVGFFDQIKGNWWKKTIGAKQAWKMAQSNHRVTVALVEPGIDSTSPDLIENMVPSEFHRRFMADGTVLEGAAAQHIEAHGTQMASIISGKVGNSIGTDGVSHNALILPITFNRLDGLVAAINHVVDVKTAADSPDCLRNIRVINLSLGISHDDSLQAAIKRAYDNGILVVASAGNEKSTDAHFPSGYRESLCVSAVARGIDFTYRTESGGKFVDSFSNRGEAVDIAAPGKDVLSISDNPHGGLAEGTSCSTAIVSGAAALLFSIDMNATPAHIANVMLNTAKRPSGTEITKQNALYGFGILNLNAAVDYMIGPDKEPLVELWPRL